MILDGLDLARPGWLFAGLPLALLWWRWWRSPQPVAGAWDAAVDAHLLPYLLASPPRRPSGWQQLRLGLAAVLAILALAGPRFESSPENLPQRSATRLLVVDLSETTDSGQLPALERLQQKLLDLLAAMPPGETGLIVYAGEPYLIVPPTRDRAILARFVPDLASDALPVPGNHPEYALAMARQILARNAPAIGDIIWVTRGSPKLPRGMANTQGIRLAILHAGAAEAPPPKASQAVRMSDDDTDIAALTTFLASNSQEQLAHANTGARDLGYWLVLPLLLLFAPSIRQGKIALLAMPMLLAGLFLPPPAAAADGGSLAGLANRLGWLALQAGDAHQASQYFRDRRWRGVAYYRLGHYAAAADDWSGLDDADTHYNRGNALAQQGKLREALDAYDRALALRPHDPDTRHNRDLVARLLRQTPTPDPSAGGQPPPPGARPPKPTDSPRLPGEQDAAQLAEQWLRQVPDEPGTLLRRKILIEHQRRQAGTAPRPW